MEHGVWGFVANGFLGYAFQAVSKKQIKVKESNNNLQNTFFLSSPSSENVGFRRFVFSPNLSVSGAFCTILPF